MIFEGRRLDDLRKQFIHSTKVSFETFKGKVLIKFIGATGVVTFWPAYETHPKDEKESS